MKPVLVNPDAFVYWVIPDWEMMAEEIYEEGVDGEVIWACIVPLADVEFVSAMLE